MAAERESPKRESQDRGAEPPTRVRPGAGPAAVSNRAMLSMIAARRDEALGAGRPLEPTVRARMESRFGTSFEDVRVHTDAAAAADALRRNARAYTRGADIVFAPGNYAPHTAGGKRLLAHELAHVVQQQRGAGLDGVPDHAVTEGEAHRAADRAEHGGPIRLSARAAPGIQMDGPNYTPAKAKVTAEPSAHHGFVKVNGEGIAGGAVGEEKWFVNSSQDPTSYHLSIAIHVPMGGDWDFYDTATKTLDDAAPSYDAVIYERRKKQNPLDLEGPSIEYWHPTHSRTKAPAPKPTVPPVKPPQKPPSKPAPTKPASVDPKSTPQDKPAVFDPSKEEPSPYKHVDHPTVQEPAFDRAKKALDEGDLATAAKLSRELSVLELGWLTPVQRSQLLWGLALNPENDTLDIAEVERIFNATPDGRVQELQRALTAGNGQLLGALEQHAKGDDLTRLGQAFNGLIMRSIANNDMEWSLPQMLGAKPQFEPPPPDGPKMHWVGEKPMWANGLEVWKDNRGSWHFYSEDTGHTELDIFGKTKRSYQLGHELFDKMREKEGQDEELKWTGGKRYIPGRGLLDDQQWEAYVEERKRVVGKQAMTGLENLEHGVKAWNETQSGWKSVPSFFAHTFGGVSSSDPQKYLLEARGDVDFELKQFGKKTPTPTALSKVEGRLLGAPKFGESQMYHYKQNVFGGAETTIVVIKVGAVTATAAILLPAAPGVIGTGLTLKGAGIAVGGGMLFSAAHQGVQIAEGSRKQFSFGDVALGGAAGLGMYVMPILIVPGATYGMAGTVDAAEQGHMGSALFGAGTMALPGAFKYGPKAWTWVQPRAAQFISRSMLGYELSMGPGGYGGAPNIPGPGISWVQPGGKTPTVFEQLGIQPSGAGTPTPGPVAPNPSAFVGPKVTPTPGVSSPYNFPLIINLAPSAPKPNPALAGPEAMKQGYGANPVVIDHDIRMPGAPMRDVPPLGTQDRYWRLRAAKADYIDPALLPFASLPGPLIVTEDEHLHATAAVKHLDSRWSRGAAPTVRMTKLQSDIKTIGDNRLTADLKAGRITRDQWLQKSRENIWQSWEIARQMGLPVEDPAVLQNQILVYEAKMRAEGIIP